MHKHLKWKRLPSKNQRQFHFLGAGESGRHPLDLKVHLNVRLLLCFHHPSFNATKSNKLINHQTYLNVTSLSGGGCGSLENKSWLNTPALLIGRSPLANTGKRKHWSYQLFNQ